MSGTISVTVTTETQLNTAIENADSDTSGTYIINFGSSITEGTLQQITVSETEVAVPGNTAPETITAAPDLTAIDLHSGVTLIINGNGDSLIGTNTLATTGTIVNGVTTFTTATATFRGLFAYSGNVQINNLTIKGAVATGGAGGTGNFAGGGGAGLGGGLFIGKSGVVTLNQVYFSADGAVGGTGGATSNGNGSYDYGGGGGLGGAGGGYGITGIAAHGGHGEPDGGGGIGRTAVGGAVSINFNRQANPGIVPNAAAGGNGASGANSNVASGAGGSSGGGGGLAGMYLNGSGNESLNNGAGAGGGGIGGHAGQSGTHGSSTDGVGGAGGVGGGGGGGYVTGGAGGFGGGGGGGYTTTGKGGFGGGGAGGGGAAGFGGGKGGGSTSTTGGGGGGGGLGAGGDIFIYSGGSLIIGSGTLAGGYVKAGAGGYAINGGATGSAGAAFGTGIFLYGNNQAATFTPASGKSVTVADVIIDQHGAEGTLSTNTGRVVLNGAGTLILSNSNTFSGGTTLEGGGTLNLNHSGAAGSGGISFGTGFDRLLVQTTELPNGGTLANTITNFVGGDVVDLPGLTFSHASVALSSSTLTVTANSTTDKLVLNSSSGSFAVAKDASGDTAVIATTFTVTSTTDLANDLSAINVGGVDSFTSVGYVFNFTSSFAIAATEQINLGSLSSVTFDGGHATTGGGYEIVGGTLIAGAAGAIGSGNIVVDGGGTLNLNGFNQTIDDLSGGGPVVLGSGTLTEGTADSTSLSGIVSGTGGLIKQGSGTLTLSANNTYSGATTIQAGVLQIGSGTGSGTIAGNVTDNATLLFYVGGGITEPVVISGTGALVMAGGGILTLTATDTYSGATMIEGGELQIGNGGASGSIGNTSGVSDSAELVVDVSSNTTLAAGISGVGALVQEGSGTLTLTGANSYAAQTTIEAGALQVGNGGTAGSIGNTNAITDNAKLIFNLSTNITEAAGISGSGALVQAGSGTLTLTGSDAYTGATTIQAGALQAGSGGASGGIGSTSSVTDNATLIFDVSSNVTLAGGISGSGVLVQEGSGTLTLTGAGTYLGATTIQAGALQVGSGGASGSIGSTASVVDNAKLIFDLSSNITEAPGISGSGALLQQGSGTLTLTAADSFSAGSTITAGELLLGSGGSLLNTGAVVVTAGTFGLNGHTQTIGDLSGGGTVVLGSGTLTVGTSNNTIFSGAISGSGALIKQGSGGLALTGTNAISGGVTLNAGTLEIGSSASIGASTIQFGGSAAVLKIDGTIMPTNTIAGFASGETFDLAGTMISGATLESGNTLLMTGSNGATLSLHLASGSNYADTAFHLVSDGTGGTDISVVNGTVTASTEADINNYVSFLDTGTVSGGVTGFTIDLANSITLSSDLDAINLPGGETLTIIGNGFTLNGGNAHRGLFVLDGTVDVQNVTLADMVAKGGAGGSGAIGGGGGAGLGGGLFVAGTNVVGSTTITGGNVTLNDVIFQSDTAIGGAGGSANMGDKFLVGGGGGGLGGAGGTAFLAGSGGGGIGSGAAGANSSTSLTLSAGKPGSNGIVIGGTTAGAGVGHGNYAGGSAGLYGGGGGSGAIFSVSYSGPGGGGGPGGSSGTYSSGNGGKGGFGGGGGGGSEHGGNSALGGAGGFGGGGGAGAGAGGFGGGGGAGYFGSGAKGGFGGGTAGGAYVSPVFVVTYRYGGGGGGLGAGGAIFVQQGGVLTIGYGAVNGGTVVGGAGGSGHLSSAHNTTTVGMNGTAGSAFGSGIFIQGTQSVTLAPGAGQTLSLSDVIADQTGSGGTSGNAGAGSLVMSGAGLVVLGTTDTFSGGLVLNNGTVQLGAGGSLNTAGAVTLDGGTFDLNSHTQTVGNLSGTGGGLVLGTGTLTAGTSSSTTLAAVISGSGELVKQGSGTLLLSALNTLTGGIVLTSGTLELGSGASPGSGTIDFATGTASLRVDGAAAPDNTISRFVSGDTIDLHGIAYQSGDTPEYNAATGELDVVNSSDQTVASLFYGPGNGGFTVAEETGGTGIVVTTNVPCFLRGTRIRTPEGEVPVEALAVGDRIVTLSGAVRPITWIGTGRVSVTRGQRGDATPIVVYKHALARNVPHHDLRITKGHSLFLDGVLIPAEFLVNHRSIAWDDRARKVEFYHIELPAHDVLVANGAPAESYRDDGNRWMFRNSNSGWDQPPKPACAPVLTGGPAVDAVWRRLLDRAGPRPGLPLTNDADLHVIADGERRDGISGGDGWHAFRLPRPPQALRIVSRAASPAELGLARDPRVLGVAVQQIRVQQGIRLALLQADDATLRDGFHIYEPAAGWRWTDGDAGLPDSLWAGFEGPLELLVRVGGVARYLAADAPPGQTRPDRSRG